PSPRAMLRSTSFPDSNRTITIRVAGRAAVPATTADGSRGSAEMPLEEFHLQQQQVLGDDLLRRHVRHSGEREYGVRPAGVSESLGQLQRMRGDNVVVGETVDDQQRAIKVRGDLEQ